MAFSDDKRAVALAIFHLFERFLGFVGGHDFFKRLLFDIAEDPFFAGTVAGRYVAPWVDEEEIGQCAARRAIAAFVATQTAVDRAVEEGATVVLESVFKASWTSAGLLRIARAGQGHLR